MTSAILTSQLLASHGFRHGFSTRHGGVSEPPFESFDFALQHSAEHLEENVRRLAERVGFAPGKLYQVTQVHGARVLTAEGSPRELASSEADGLIAEPGTGHAVAVRVADCVPVLLACPRTGRVAAVHAGWRGVEAKIVQAAASRMVEAGGSDASGFVAAIGPCIGPCCFETAEDVAHRLSTAVSPDIVVRRDEVLRKAYIDLRRAVRIQLTDIGISSAHIEDVPSASILGCTRCEASSFYSFRRDGERSGRLVGVIVAGPR